MKLNNKTIKGLLIWVSAICIVLIITLGLVIKLYVDSNNRISNTNNNNSINSLKTSVTVNDDTTKVVKKVQDSVVSVGLYQNKDFVGIGSGSIVGYKDNYAYILTNNHVVDFDNKYDIKVIFNNKKEYKSEIVGKDAISDLALLKVKVDFKVNVIEIGNSDNLQTGESVIAIGSPFDISFSGTVTKGIISGLNRIIDTDTNGDNIADYATPVIQTDTTINPGNSGGPLINMAGQMVGVNTSKISESGFENMGFAIPSNDAMDIVEQLIAKGKISRPQLGISYYAISTLKNQNVNPIQIPSNIKEGLYIIEVNKNGAAAKAGLKNQDIIYGINNKDLTSTIDFTSILYKSKTGDTLKLNVYRNGKNITINVSL
ncbi:MAG: trypsin-like peptidase domain-containing protein [Bacilli bacterium]|jgi:serine protease Do|nr:trypsin-like peptidase domain-containing protein [Bacilli bacterium]